MLGKLIKDLLFGERTARRAGKAEAVSLLPIAAGAHSGIADVAVVMITVCRESLLRAVRSVFEQDYQGTIHILIGVDIDRSGRAAELREVLSRECPPNVQLTWFDPGYSTSRRNGGVHACFYGGALRTILTFLANAPIVAYLDDDDWYGRDHLRRILAAIDGKSWAFSLCYYADGDTGEGLCVDELESVGVGAGVFKDRFGGFVRSSALAVNKLALAPYMHLWSETIGPQGDGEDRLIFNVLRTQPHGATGVPTVYYALDPRDGMHPLRVSFMQSRGITAAIPQFKTESVRA